MHLSSTHTHNNTINAGKHVHYIASNPDLHSSSVDVVISYLSSSSRPNNCTISSYHKSDALCIQYDIYTIRLIQ